MRGIDLYKEILDGETKYEGKKFKYDGIKIIVENNDIWLSYDNRVLSLSARELERFFKAELTEIVTPIPWQECIQKWAENPKKYKIQVVYDGVSEFYCIRNGYIFEDEEGCSVSTDEILKGTWYLLEK